MRITGEEAREVRREGGRISMKELKFKMEGTRIRGRKREGREGVFYSVRRNEQSIAIPKSRMSIVDTITDRLTDK